MRVVVTGAAGYVGSALLREMAASDQVTAVDRRAVRAWSSASPWPGRRPTFTEICADLLDPLRHKAIRQVLLDADAVVHLAGCPGVRDDRPDVARRRARDNGATARLVCALTPPDVPLVVLSSSSVYGGSRGRPSTETDPLAPRGGYAESKVLVEEECAARAERGRVLVVRPFTVIGEGQRPDMAVSLWATAIARGEPVTVFGSLDRTRDLTCVRQAARAIRELARTGASGTVNLGGGRPRTLGELVAALERVLGRRADVRLRPAATREVPDTWADTTRLGALLGWVPETDLDDAVRRAVGRPDRHRWAS